MILADKSVQVLLDLILAQFHPRPCGEPTQRLGLGPMSTSPALTGKCVEAQKYYKRKKKAFYETHKNVL